jgi:hypothetical protein
MKAKNIGTMVWTGVALAACLLLPAYLTAAPLLEYRFNEAGGTTATNTGFAVGGLSDPAQMYDSSLSDADLHSADGTGVSGLAGDRALDNTLEGGGAAGGLAGHTGTIVTPAPPVSVESLTISGWLKNVDTAHMGSPKYIYMNETGSGPSTRTALLLHPWGTLQLVVSNGSNNISTEGAYNSVYEGGNAGAAPDWTFFAVTFDGTSASESDRMKFYVGNTTTAVSLVNVNISTATSTEHNKWFGVGNISLVYGAVQPVIGLIDNFRIWHEATGSAGALSMSELEAFRAADIIPEPATMALLGLGGVLMLVRRRR